MWPTVPLTSARPCSAATRSGSGISRRSMHAQQFVRSVRLQVDLAGPAEAGRHVLDTGPAIAGHDVQPAAPASREPRNPREHERHENASRGVSRYFLLLVVALLALDACGPRTNTGALTIAVIPK